MNGDMHLHVEKERMHQIPDLYDQFALCIVFAAYRTYILLIFHIHIYPRRTYVVCKGEPMEYGVWVLI
jgi:hypothetical protein